MFTPDFRGPWHRWKHTSIHTLTYKYARNHTARKHTHTIKRWLLRYLICGTSLITSASYLGQHQSHTSVCNDNIVGLVWNVRWHIHDVSSLLSHSRYVLYKTKYATDLLLFVWCSRITELWNANSHFMGNACNVINFDISWHYSLHSPSTVMSVTFSGDAT